MGLNECFFISDLRDVIAWSLHGGEELIKPTRMRLSIFSVWWKRGNSKMLFWGCFPNKIYCYSLRYSFYACLVALIVYSRDCTACSSTNTRPTYKPLVLILWGRRNSHPFIYPVSPPYQSDGASKQTSSWFCLDHLVTTCVRFCTGLDFGYEACLSNVLWNCGHVWLWITNQLVFSLKAG